MKSTPNAARWPVVAFAILSLAGCATPPAVRTEVIEVERTRIVQVPDRLTAPTSAPDVPARALYCDDLERLVRGYEASLAKCNADKACTRDLGRSAESGQAPAKECGQ